MNGLSLEIEVGCDTAAGLCGMVETFGANPYAMSSRDGYPAPCMFFADAETAVFIFAKSGKRGEPRRGRKRTKNMGSRIRRNYELPV
jgi:hypothetical protein